MQVLLICFAAACLLNICYYLGFLRFSLSGPPRFPKDGILPVSVIVCAKNEAENLRRFLPSILSQEHPNFEVVVINDASTDETLQVIEEFQQQDPRIKIVDVKNNEAFWANKKYALTLGIKKAIHPYLLFTEADCQCETSHWITEMTAPFSSGKDLVLGYGGYFKKKNSLLNKFIRFETLLTAIQYFSYAKWGIPYMGVGRNLSYSANLFYTQSGFASHLHLRSGEDSIFVNRAATARNTALGDTSRAITRSVPKKTLAEWFRKKRRQVSVSTQFKFKHRFLLGLFYFSQISFYGFFTGLLFTSYWKIALGLLVLRVLLQGVVLYKAARKFKETDVLWLFPFLEVFLIFSQFGIFISNLISKPKHWK